MERTPLANLAMVMRHNRLSGFFPLLQQGVWVSCRVEVPLADLLVNQWGIAADYVTGRITTMFLNSRAVDSIKTSVVSGGSTVALSGAMPGLVGATMRAGGFYAAMRGAMTFRADDSGRSSGIDRVKVKLFNLLLQELGPGFLARGFIMTAGELAAFLEGGEFLAEAALLAATLDTRPLPPGELAAALAGLGGEELLLTVDFEETS
jgi:hypothetical protein